MAAFASLVYYGWWNPAYLLLIVGSLTGNYLLSGAMDASQGKVRKGILIADIVINISLLGYYKYIDFFISSVNALTGAALPLQNIVLPLPSAFLHSSRWRIW
ncbi:hypothetical protein [Oleidesulfovibrio sp.]|uniref:hypothetical protein n=1 Tax=Oleidesulfovibrio sp. TaxID=2909707 RepID=UPI003A8C2BA4